VFGLAYVENTKWGGLPLTLLLSVFGIALAFPLSVLLALGRQSALPAIRALAVGYIELIRGVPLISLLFMASVMFPLFLPEGVSLDKLLRAQAGIVLFAAAYLAEVVRGGLQSIPKGQIEAADALGLGYWQKMRFIVLPQALKAVIPPMVGTFIGIFKDTSLVLVIGLFDLLSTVRSAIADPEWRAFYVEGYVVAALIYFAFCFFMSRTSRKLEGAGGAGRAGEPGATM
jgi:general L-amino acid transport system permease protein